ncbi:MAG: ABC transporter permease [Solirubrobacterales bacterium]|nr:ABC transporter permease [Solirubrobacterales bacterium]
MSATTVGYDDCVELPFGSAAYWKAFAKSIPVGVWIAIVLVTLFVIAAVAPGVLESQSPAAQDLTSSLGAPSLSHLFGTDQLGRDEFSRVVAGTGQSVIIGLVATGIAVVAAIALGLAAGLGGRWADAIVSRLLEVLFSFPILLLALLILTIFGASLSTEIAAVAIGTAPGYARMLRGQLVAVRDAGYVEAARAVGHPYGRIVSQHIFPNAIRPLVSLYTLGIGQSVIWASGLSFLGVGPPPNSPDWGTLLYAGRDYVSAAWWLEVAPGFVIVVLAVSVTVIGRHLQDRLEGRVRVSAG